MKNFFNLILIFLFIPTICFPSKMSDALQEYQKGEYKICGEILKKLQVAKPFDSQINYNLGIACYKQNKFEDAKNNFERAFEHVSQENSQFKEEIAFNWANSFYKNTLDILGRDWEKKDCGAEKLNKAENEVKLAIEKYKKALEIDASNERSKSNLKSAEDLLHKIQEKKQKEKQKQQNKDKEKQKDKENKEDKKDSKDNQQNKDNKDQKDNNEKKDQDKSGKKQDDSQKDKQEKNQKNNEQKDSQEKNEKKEKGGGEQDADSQKGKQDKKKEQGRPDDGAEEKEKESKNKKKQKQEQKDLEKKEDKKPQQGKDKQSAPAEHGQDDTEMRGMRAFLDRLQANEKENQKKLMLQKIKSSAAGSTSQKNW